MAALSRQVATTETPVQSQAGNSLQLRRNQTGSKFIPWMFSRRNHKFTLCQVGIKEPCVQAPKSPVIQRLGMQRRCFISKSILMRQVVRDRRQLRGRQVHQRIVALNRNRKVIKGNVQPSSVQPSAAREHGGETKQDEVPANMLPSVTAASARPEAFAVAFDVAVGLRP